jgi:hypothetical protein
MGKDVIVVLHRRETAEAFLRGIGILAIGSLIHDCTAREAPADGFTPFFTVLDHEYRMHELSVNDYGFPVFMNGVFPDQLAEHGAVRPRGRVTGAHRFDGRVIAQNDFIPEIV